MDDRTYLLGKVAALQSALDAAISTHPEPARLNAALAQAMSSYLPEYRLRDVRAFAEGWMAIVTPLLTDQACADCGASCTVPGAPPRGGRDTH